MLLEFRTRNYKSFADEMVFSMTPAPKQKGLDYSVLTQKAGSKDYKGLCSAVIYGPNASGKTNVIGAMDTFKSIVLRGNINNADAVSLNVAASSLELVPNCNGSAAPTEFGIRFVDNGLFVDYSIIIDLGTFLDKDGQPIEFKNDDDDDMPVSFREREYYQADDNEITDAGYTIEDIEDHLDDDPDGLPAELNDLLGGIAEAQEDYNEGEEE